MAKFTLLLKTKYSRLAVFSKYRLLPIMLVIRRFHCMKAEPSQCILQSLSYLVRDRKEMVEDNVATFAPAWTTVDVTQLLEQDSESSSPAMVDYNSDPEALAATTRFNIMPLPLRTCLY